VQPNDSVKMRVQRIAGLEREAAKSRRWLKEAAPQLVDGDIDKIGYELVRESATRSLAAVEEELGWLDAAPEREFPTLDVVLGALPSWGGANRGGRDPDPARGAAAVV
jgi:hypothetical protein